MFFFPDDFSDNLTLCRGIVTGVVVDCLIGCVVADGIDRLIDLDVADVVEKVFYSQL